MKYQNEVIIELPIAKVIELFDDPDNIAKWQAGFISFDHISGEKGQIGAVSKIIYQMGKRKIEMKETIVKRDLPHEFTAIYETGKVMNEIFNHFEKINENQTKWISKNIFHFNGFIKYI